MQVDLFDPGAAPGPRPAWQVIEAARRRYLTGQLVLDTDPVTNIYLRDGQVYFAERTSDGALPVRLMVEGVITRAQMQKATLQVSGVDHLGRMFERDDSIDRDAVELCVELMTDEVLTSIATSEVANWSMLLYQRHPSGLDRWLPTRIEVITHLVPSEGTADPRATVVAAPLRTKSLTPPPPTGEVKVQAPEPAPVVAEPVVEPVTPVAEPAAVPPVDEHVEHVDDAESADHVHEPVAPVTEVTEQPTDEEPQPFRLPGSTTPIAVPAFSLPTFDSAPTIEQPATPPVAPLLHGFGGTPGGDPDETPVEERPLVRLAPSAMEAIMSTSIKDEVAEAVRRALAEIEHG